MTIYAIGDIHGQLALLHGAYAKIEEDRAREGTGDAPVVHVGDFTDRGPDARGVLDLLIANQAEGAPHIYLKGNHDRMMAHFMRPGCEPDPSRPDLNWLDDMLGGRATLDSYGVDTSYGRRIPAIHADARAAVPEAHITFLEGLPLYHETPDHIFVHAGISPGVPLAEQSEDNLVWIRRPFLDDTSDHGKLVVHGHTPVGEVTHAGNRLAIDTGAAYGRALSVVALEGPEVFVLTFDGRVPVQPTVMS